MAGNGKFIAQATANAHGQFKAKAKKAGSSTAAFAAKMKNQRNKNGGMKVTAKQAQLAAELMKLHSKKAAAPVDAEDLKDGGADEAQEASPKAKRHLTIAIALDPDHDGDNDLLNPDESKEK